MHLHHYLASQEELATAFPGDEWGVEPLGDNVEIILVQWGDDIVAYRIILKTNGLKLSLRFYVDEHWRLLGVWTKSLLDCIELGFIDSIYYPMPYLERKIRDNEWDIKIVEDLRI